MELVTTYLQLCMTYEANDRIMNLVTKKPTILQLTTTRLSLAQYAVITNFRSLIEFIKKKMPTAFFIVGRLRLPPIIIAAQRGHPDLVQLIDECTREHLSSALQKKLKDHSMVIYRGHYPLIERILGNREADVQSTLSYYLDTQADLTNDQEIDPTIFRQLMIFGASLSRYFADRPNLDRRRCLYINDFMELRRRCRHEQDEKASAWCYIYLPVPEVPFLYGLLD